MYATGTISDFESRLHQLGNETGAYSQFTTEYGNYSGLLDVNWNAKCQREFDSIEYRISGMLDRGSWLNRPTGIVY
jgi:hypothetical protein